MNIEKIREVCSGTVIGKKDNEITGVCSDTRKNFTGSVYIALIGERFDGHDYIEKAIEGGSLGIVWSEEDISEKINGLSEKYPDISFVRVKNTLNALGMISGEIFNSKRRSFEAETGKKMPVVAITGSVGKTTTKEMTALALSAKYNVCKTKANHNNEIGVPNTIMSLENENALVVEFGMRGMGQIQYLTDIVRPTVGVITNVGTAHLELLGSRSRIFMAKAEIVSGIEEGGSLIVNGDNDYLSNKKQLDAYINRVYDKKLNIYTVGEGPECDFRITDVRENPESCSFAIVREETGSRTEISLNVGGRHNVMDGALAFAAAVISGADPEKAGVKLSDFGKETLRQIVTEKKGVKIIDDTYNANPDSMKAALSVLKAASGRKIAVLGSMFELGEKTEEFHRQVGEYAADCCDILITAGEEAKKIKEGFEEARKRKNVMEYECFECRDSEEASVQLLKVLKKGDTVLAKGSRGMYMEKVVKYFNEVWS